MYMDTSYPYYTTWIKLKNANKSSQEFWPYVSTLKDNPQTKKKSVLYENEKSWSGIWIDLEKLTLPSIQFTETVISHQSSKHSQASCISTSKEMISRNFSSSQ